MSKGAIYARVSTTEADGDDDGSPLQDPSRQIEDCRELLEEKGVEEIDLFTDRESGAVDDRDDLQDLLTGIEAGEFDCVCMSEISRLARRTATAANFIDVCVEEQEVPIYLTDDMISEISPTNPMSAFFAKFLSTWYEEERKQTIRRIKSGMKQAQRQGKWTGRPPKGFEVNDGGVLVPDVEEYLAVQTALERVLSGESKNKVSNETGVSRRTIQRILDDPERRRLYLEAEADDDRVQTALDEADVDSAELPPEFEQRMREIVKEELHGGEE